MTTSKEIARITKDNFAKLIGIKLSFVQIGKAEATLEIKECHHNGVGIIQGGAIFTLADFAFAAAANSREDIAISISASISYYHAVSNGILTAKAYEKSFHRKIAHYHVDIIHSSGQLIAAYEGTAYRKKPK